jgi:hypothetical protein
MSIFAGLMKFLGLSILEVLFVKRPFRLPPTLCQCGPKSSHCFMQDVKEGLSVLWVAYATHSTL